MASNTLKDGVDTKALTESTFPVYMIYSDWSLPQLDTFLAKYGNVGFLRIVYDNDGKETNRTIAVLPETAYDALCSDGYDHRQYGRGIKISQFLLNESNFPGEGRNKTLFVPVPKDLGGDDSQVISAIVDKLKHLAEWNIIPADSWSVNVPLKSREKGGVRSGCFISFKREVVLDRIAMARVLLTDTYWPEENAEAERPVFRCFWARDRKEYVPKTAGKSSSSGKTEESPEDQVKVKEEKKRRSIQNLAKGAKPVGKFTPKKASTVPITVQPTLKTDSTSA